MLITHKAPNRGLIRGVEAGPGPGEGGSRQWSNKTPQFPLMFDVFKEQSKLVYICDVKVNLKILCYILYLCLESHFFRRD